MPDMVPAAIVTGRLALLVFSSFWQLYSSENWAWTWHSCLDCANSGSAKCAGTPAVSAARAMVLEPFSSLWQLAIRGLLWLILLCCLAHSHTYTFPRLGSFSVSPHVRHLQDAPVGILFCFSVHQALKEPSWWKSSAAQCIRFLKGHPLWGLSAVQCWCVGRERLQRWFHSCAWLRSIALSPCLPAFLHKHFPLQSPPSGLLGPSPHSQ